MNRLHVCLKFGEIKITGKATKYVLNENKTSIKNETYPFECKVPTTQEPVKLPMVY